MGHAIHTACENGKLAEVKDLVENQGISVDLPEEPNGKLPIHIAAQAGHLEVVDYLIGKSAKTSTHYENKTNFGLLYYACLCEDEDKRKKLLEYIYNNFDKCRFDDGTIKLHVAAALGYVKECQINKAHFLVANQSNETPLFFSVYKGHYDMIELIYSTEEKFNNIDSISDDEKRTFAQIYQVCGDVQSENGDDSIALESYDYAARFINAIVEKTDQDLRNLIQASHDFCTIRQDFSLHVYAKILSKILESFNNIKNKIDQDYRNMAKAYSSYSDAQYNNKKYLESANTTQQAIDFLKSINQKTDCDIQELENQNAKLAYAYQNHGHELNEAKKLHDAADMFLKALNELRYINDMLNPPFKKMRDIYLKLAKIFQILPLHPNRIHPVICYRNAINSLLKSREVYEYLPALKDIYGQWATYYSDHTLGKRFSLMSALAFTQFSEQTKFSQLFMQIYCEITEARNSNELMEWLPSLIQLMEVLLKINNIFDRPLTNGLQFLKADPQNLKFFHESLAKFKSLYPPALSKSLEQGDVVPIALFKKMNVMQTTLDDFQQKILQLENDNATLRSELAELKSQSANTTIFNNAQVVQKLPATCELPSSTCTTITATVTPVVDEMKTPTTTVEKVTESDAKTSLATSPFWDQPKITRKLSDLNNDERADDTKRHKFETNM